jgi:hypothetical protein
MKMATRIGKPALLVLGLAVIAVVCFASLTLPGCSVKQTGDITGSVICDGEPVLMGEVILQDPEGHSVSGGIDSGGHYTILQAPVGSMQVAITGRIRPPVGDRKAVQKRLYELMEKARVKAEKAGKKFSPSDFDDPDVVPQKYTGTKTSGLTIDVKPGLQHHDFTLDGAPKE